MMFKFDMLCYQRVRNSKSQELIDSHCKYCTPHYDNLKWQNKTKVNYGQL